MGITERKRLGVEQESMMKQLEHQKAKLLDALRLMPAGVIVAVKPPEKTTLANGLAQKDTALHPPSHECFSRLRQLPHVPP